jgi:hypothetical protein
MQHGTKLLDRSEMALKQSASRARVLLAFAFAIAGQVSPAQDGFPEISGSGRWVKGSWPRRLLYWHPI